MVGLSLIARRRRKEAVSMPLVKPSGPQKPIGACMPSLASLLAAHVSSCAFDLVRLAHRRRRCCNWVRSNRGHSNRCCHSNRGGRRSRSRPTFLERLELCQRRSRRGLHRRRHGEEQLRHRLGRRQVRPHC